MERKNIFTPGAALLTTPLIIIKLITHSFFKSQLLRRTDGNCAKQTKVLQFLVVIVKIL